MEALVFSDLSLREELDSVEKYLTQETIRYEGKLSWTCSLDNDADTKVIIPKSLLGVFIENAIMHGLIQNGSSGNIEISAHNTSLGMLIMVNDHGIHFEDISLIRQQRDKRLRELDAYLRIFNENHPYIIHYDILDRSLGDADLSGSRVLITIQYQ